MCEVKFVKFTGKYEIDDYIGKKFGLLVVDSISTSHAKDGSKQWLFRCECGKTVLDTPYRVISGHRKSCGCMKFKNMTCENIGFIPRNLLSKTEIIFYNKWERIRTRCYNKKHQKYPIYGGRGVVMCDEWRTNAWNFINWCKETHPGDFSLTIDRIDSNGLYSPDNCRWANTITQNRNRSNTSKVIYDGEEITLAELAEENNIRLETLRKRVKSGWSIEKALTTPVKKVKK